MSRKGNYWDNAVAESFFGSLKKERVKKQIYKTRASSLCLCGISTMPSWRSQGFMRPSPSPGWCAQESVCKGHP
jgi:transposase InsO family protein